MFLRLFLSLVFLTPLFAEEYIVGSRTVKFYDNGRNRPIVFDIWYQAKKEAPQKKRQSYWREESEARDAPIPSEIHDKPLIIFSHGNGGDRYSLLWLVHPLVKKGYVVVGVDHFGNTWYNKLPEHFLAFWHRPQDVSYVLDHLATHTEFSLLIDESRIGFFGYSLGGLTGIWLMGGQALKLQKPTPEETKSKEFPVKISQRVIDSIDWQEAKELYFDERIKASFLIAPAFGQLFSPENLKRINVPTFIVSGTDDMLVPPAPNALYYANNIPHAKYDRIERAGHYVFLREINPKAYRKLPSYLHQDAEGVDREKVHKEVSEMAISFFDQHLKNTPLLSLPSAH